MKPLSTMSGTELWALGIFVLLIIVCFIMTLLVYSLVNLLYRQNKSNRGELVNDDTSLLSDIWDNFYQNQTQAVPIEAEGSIIMDHNYDGIQELDNHLPPWWKNLFYITIVFGVIYLGVYHLYEFLPLQLAEYQGELAQAEKDKAAFEASGGETITASNVKLLLTDAATMSKGAEVFKANCVSCHGQKGEGGVGPNMADNYYLHGNTIQDVFKTVHDGWPQKGMISWKGTLKPIEMQAVSNYVISLHGTNPANPKAPQGILMEPNKK